MRDDFGPNGIAHDSATESQEIRVRLAQHGGEPALKEVPHPVVSAVDDLRVSAIELPHALREIRRRRFDQEMIVVIHQTVGMAAPPKAIDDLG